MDNTWVIDRADRPSKPSALPNIGTRLVVYGRRHVCRSMLFQDQLDEEAVNYALRHEDSSELCSHWVNSAGHHPAAT